MIQPFILGTTSLGENSSRSGENAGRSNLWTEQDASYEGPQVRVLADPPSPSVIIALGIEAKGWESLGVSHRGRIGTRMRGTLGLSPSQPQLHPCGYLTGFTKY